MKDLRFELGFATVLLAFVVAVWCWQNPGTFQSRATAAEIDAYLEVVASLPAPEQEKRG